jgi:very-short-patch-repair endonuclease
MRISSPRVRELRRNQTEAEKAAWYLLRGRRLGARFRRQHPVGNGVVDFFCREYRLAIELDGGVHSQPSQMRKDALREDYLRGLGIRLLRLPNGLVLEDPEGFVRKVREWIGAVMDRAGPAEQVTPHPARYARHPLPKGEG